MEYEATQLVPMILEIIFIDLILSGDNAVVIALATRSLRSDLRFQGILFGTIAAILMRVTATALIGLLMIIPALKLFAAGLLLYVAIKLTLSEDGDDPTLPDSTNLWGAVKTIAVADAVMSLDNVLAVAAAADGNFGMMIFGLLISMPFLIYGSTLVARIIEHFPMAVPLCGGLLGWIAGALAVGDPLIHRYVLPNAPDLVVVGPVVGTIFVMTLSRILARRMAEDKPPEADPSPAGAGGVESAREV